ncbi:MAG TPA: ABC transporter substrate-binding protein, partial [Gaiellaceae bacterium]|nr:ABC transporter substrate-binding protein [Gaiellaceae bacterium]
MLLAGALSPVAAVERGGELTFGRYADSLLLDPVWNDANVDIWIFTNLYDTLIRSSPDGKGLEPGLATEWTVSDDGTEVTLTLREGVKFADGSDMTAEDVKWSLDRARNPENGIWNGLIGSIGSVEIADPQTIVLKLKNPDPTIIPALAVFNTAIMPKALYEAEPGATDAEKAESFAKHPIGTGPFVFESWERGSKMRIVRNPHHWEQGEDGQPLPYLDAVTFEIIPDDATR